jgi:sugar phosphate isomerase/epimerase
MKAALSSTTLRGYSPRALAEAAVRLAYDAVEIWSGFLWESGEEVAALGKSIKDKNLLLSIHGPSRDLNATSLNQGIRRKSRVQYMKSIEDAARIEAGIVNLHPGAFSSSHDKAEAFIPEMTDYSGELSVTAARPGIRVALEVKEVRTGEHVTDIPTAAGPCPPHRGNPRSGSSAAVDLKILRRHLRHRELCAGPSNRVGRGKSKRVQAAAC